MGIFAGIFRRRVAAGAPVVREVAAAAVERVTARVVERIRNQPAAVSPDAATALPPAVQQSITTQVAADLRANPVAANQLGLERLRESRVVMSSIIATIQTSGMFLTGLAGQLGAFGVQLSAAGSGPGRWVTLGVAIFGGGGLISNIYTLYGRLKTDLPPMHNRWYNPFSWLARDLEEVEAQPAAPIVPGNG